MKDEELYQKFKLAIENEFAAYQMYKDIAEGSEDPELKIIFQRIASEEWEHRELIMKRYAILKGYQEDQ